MKLYSALVVMLALAAAILTGSPVAAASTNDAQSGATPSGGQAPAYQSVPGSLIAAVADRIAHSLVLFGGKRR